MEGEGNGILKNNSILGHRQVCEWGDSHCARSQGQVGMMSFR